MRTIEAIEEAGPDKLLRLTIPVDEGSRRYHVVVMIEPERSLPTNGSKEMDSWPEGYFEDTAGAWHGEFAREAEGGYEQREDL